MSFTILRKCENFSYAIQGDTDWSNLEQVQEEAKLLCDKCIEWLNAENKNHEQFGPMVATFFPMLQEIFQRKVLPEQEVREFRDSALEQIHSFSQDRMILSFLEYNTSLGDSDNDSSSGSDDEI